MGARAGALLQDARGAPSGLDRSVPRHRASSVACSREKADKTSKKTRSTPERKTHRAKKAVHDTRKWKQSPPAPTRDPRNGHHKQPAPSTLTPARTWCAEVGVVADVISYNSAISACEKGAQWEKAFELLKIMQDNAVRALLLRGRVRW